MALHLPTYFADFLRRIRPTLPQRKDMAAGHRVLRDRLMADEDLSPGIVTTFLQGSYRRYTAVRPRDEKRPDVDIIVVTRMAESEYTPDQAMKRFKPFLEKHYKDKYEVQGRSFGIELSYVDMDLVITSAPSEAEVGVYAQLGKVEEQVRLDEELEEQEDKELIKKAEMELPAWKLGARRIPDRDAGQWQDTHPLAQLEWTSRKNADCFRHYVNVVKALKWWRLVHAAELPDRPKSYPLEHLIGDCCPDRITSVAEGIVLTLEAIASQYAPFAAAKQPPFLRDRGVNQNVMARIKGEDFAAFYRQAKQAAEKARGAFEAKDAETAAPLWRQLLGEEFPSAPEGNGGTSTGGFTPRQEGPGKVGGGRFARG